MADFYALAVKLEDISKEYFKLTQNANEAYKREYDAAVNIQSFFRGWVVRVKFQEVIRAARQILRVARGVLARWRVVAVRVTKVKESNMHFFHHCASIIQKFWRGFRSRRKYHDFYKRRGYLDQVVAKGNRTVEFLRRQFKEKLEEVQIERERATHEAFAELTSQMHHLVSTRHISGVFNPPYAPHLPSAFSKPLEQHLRDNSSVGPIKALRRPLYGQQGDALLVPKSARADFAGTQDSNDTQRPEQVYPTPPSQAPPNQRAPRPPKVVQDGKVLPMKSPRAPKSGQDAPKSPSKLPSLPGSPRKMPQTAR